MRVELDIVFGVHVPDSTGPGSYAIDGRVKVSPGSDCRNVGEPGLDVEVLLHVTAHHPAHQWHLVLARGFVALLDQGRCRELDAEGGSLTHGCSPLG